MLADTDSVLSETLASRRCLDCRKLCTENEDLKRSLNELTHKYNDLNEEATILASHLTNKQEKNARLQKEIEELKEFLTANENSRRAFNSESQSAPFETK